MDTKKYIQEVVEEINQHRKEHGVPKLEYDTEIEKIAQKFANKLADQNKLEFSDNEFKNEGLGESVYLSNEYIEPDNFVDVLYDEISSYNFKLKDNEASNFTQMVWKDSKYIGVGIKKNGLGGTFYVINYFPSGNIEDKFEENVFPIQILDESKKKKEIVNQNINITPKYNNKEKLRSGNNQKLKGMGGRFQFFDNSSSGFGNFGQMMGSNFFNNDFNDFFNNFGNDGMNMNNNGQGQSSYSYYEYSGNGPDGKKVEYHYVNGQRVDDNVNEDNEENQEPEIEENNSLKYEEEEEEQKPKIDPIPQKKSTENNIPNKEQKEQEEDNNKEEVKPQPFIGGKKKVLIKNPDDDDDDDDEEEPKPQIINNNKGGGKKVVHNVINNDNGNKKVYYYFSGDGADMKEFINKNFSDFANFGFGDMGNGGTKITYNFSGEENNNNNKDNEEEDYYQEENNDNDVEEDAGSGTVEADQFNQDALQAHNKYRQKHHVKNLKLNKDLISIAQNYANELASTDSFNHSDNSYKGEPLGENLYMMSGAVPGGKTATDSWYNEIKKYNFNGDYQSGTGHFTQIVWKGTTDVGFGIAQSGSGAYYIVGNYYPAGNWQGEFKHNVLKP